MRCEGIDIANRDFWRREFQACLGRMVPISAIWEICTCFIQHNCCKEDHESTAEAYLASTISLLNIWSRSEHEFGTSHWGRRVGSARKIWGTRPACLLMMIIWAIFVRQPMSTGTMLGNRESFQQACLLLSRNRIWGFEPFTPTWCTWKRRPVYIADNFDILFKL